MTFGDKQYILELHDSGGETFKEGKQSARKEMYANKDIVIICCAKNDRESFKDVDNYSKITDNVSPDTPKILVMTKIDESDEEDSVT